MIRKEINNKGFSLMEILVVIGIFTASITAIYSLVFKNINVQKYNKDFLVASMLAQEGLELVRQVRDENWRVESTGGEAWTGLVLVSSDDFIIDYRPSLDSLVNVSSGDDDITDNENCRLFINGGFYSHEFTGNESKFYRIIEVNGDGSQAKDGVEFSSRVQWREGGAKKEYVASTVLYDWK